MDPSLTPEQKLLLSKAPYFAQKTLTLLTELEESGQVLSLEETKRVAGLKEEACQIILNHWEEKAFESSGLNKEEQPFQEADFLQDFANNLGLEAMKLIREGNCNEALLIAEEGKAWLQTLTDVDIHQKRSIESVFDAIIQRIKPNYTANP